MKVLKYGKLRVKQCPTCGSILQYDITNPDDVHTADGDREYEYSYIVCLVCQTRINVTKELKEYNDNKDNFPYVGF